MTQFGAPSRPASMGGGGELAKEENGVLKGKAMGS